MPISVDKKQFEQISEINFTSKNEISAKLELSEEEVLSVIFENATACLEFEECSTGEVRYGGKAYFTVITSSGELKKIETGVEFMFKEEVKGALAGDGVCGYACVENVKTTLKNGIATVTGILIYKGAVQKKTECEYLCLTEGANAKRVEVTSLASPVRYSAEFKVEDEFDLPVAVTDVLWHGETVKINTVSAGIGAVNIEGEIEISMLIKTPDGGVEMQTKCLPMRFEGETVSVLPSSRPIICALVKGAKLSVTSYEQSSKSTVSAFVTLSFNGYVYETETHNLLVDAYSVSNELLLDKKDYKLTEIKGVVTENCKATQNGALKLSENARLICPLFVKIESVELNSLVNGVATVTVLVKEENSYKAIKTPVNYSLPITVKEDMRLYSVSANGLTANQNGKEVNVEFSLNLAFCLVDKKMVSAVCSVAEGEPRPVRDSAITVCVPESGDTLWDLVKTLGVSEEEVVKLNDNLEFPLTGEERIVIYREINKE